MVQNITGAGGDLAFNFMAEKGGARRAHHHLQPLPSAGAGARRPQPAACRYQDFEFLGGAGDTRINYMRTDAVRGRRPEAERRHEGRQRRWSAPSTLIPTSPARSRTFRWRCWASGTSSLLGYRGGADVFLAMQRNEVQFHNTSIGTFRTRSAAFVRAGEAIGIAYLVTVGPPMIRSSAVRRSARCRRLPDLYREVHRKPPSGGGVGCAQLAGPGQLQRAALWGRLRRAACRRRRLPSCAKGSSVPPLDPGLHPGGRLRATAFPTAMSMSRAETAIIRALAEVSPGVLATLRSAVGAPN